MPLENTGLFMEALLNPLLRTKKRLLIVPPFWSLDMPCLGVHILHSLARQAGFEVDILYANILFASRIGVEKYINISSGMDMKMLGERVFARAAHQKIPLLGYNREQMFSSDHVVGDLKAREFASPYLIPPVKRSITEQDLIETAEEAEDWTNELAETLTAFSYEIIGFSSSYEQTNCSLALMKALKKRDPSLTTCMGGANCKYILAEGITSLDKKREWIDYIFSGESENSFPRFLKQHSEGRLPENRIIRGEKFQTLDKLAPPLYDDYFTQMEAFFPDNKQLKESVLLPLESSRGCSWGEHQTCTFCGLVTEEGATRVKDPGLVLDEIKNMKEKYGVTQFSTTDLLMPPAYNKTFVPALAEAGLDVRIMFEQKAALSLEQLLALKEAGIIWILAGIESFSNSLLKLMHKGTTAAQNIRLLRYGAMAGINITWNLLWGFPSDRKSDYETMVTLLPLISHLCPPAAMMHLSLNRFSPYFEKAADFEISGLTPLAPYFDVFPRESDIYNLAYQFTGDYKCGSHEHKDIIKELVSGIKEWQEKWKSGSGSVLRINKLGASYLLMDSRGLPGTGGASVITPEQARIALTGQGTENKELLEWALKNKTGLMLNDVYIPLTVCDKQLLKEI